MFGLRRGDCVGVCGWILWDLGGWMRDLGSCGRGVWYLDLSLRELDLWA